MSEVRVNKAPGQLDFTFPPDIIKNNAAAVADSPPRPAGRVDPDNWFQGLVFLTKLIGFPDGTGYGKVEEWRLHLFLWSWQNKLIL
jgi:hypothetical protein